jgi:hypothetical protein
METAKHFDLNRQVAKELRKVRNSLQNSMGILNMWLEVLEHGVSELECEGTSSRSLGNKQPKRRKKT